MARWYGSVMNDRAITKPGLLCLLHGINKGVVIKLCTLWYRNHSHIHLHTLRYFTIDGVRYTWDMSSETVTGPQPVLNKFHIMFMYRPMRSTHTHKCYAACLNSDANDNDNGKNNANANDNDDIIMLMIIIMIMMMIIIKMIIIIMILITIMIMITITITITIIITIIIVLEGACKYKTVKSHKQYTCTK